MHIQKTALCRKKHTPKQRVQNCRLLIWEMIKHLVRDKIR